MDRIKALGNAIVPQVAYEIMNSLNLIAAQVAKERGAVFNNFQAELSNEEQNGFFPERIGYICSTLAPNFKILV